MILIADAGSTKTDWVVLNDKFDEKFRIQTVGLNPSIHSVKVLNKEIAGTKDLLDIKNEVDEVFFYGAGCGSKEKKEIMTSVLKGFFSCEKIAVHEDMLGAVYATSGLLPSIICILGTGSNSCYFDGETIQKNTPSLGYAIMDEASGNYFGKRLIRDYFYNKMPEKIADSFQKKYNLEINEIITNLYFSDSPNKYLASFARFLLEFKEEKYVQKIVKKGIKKFFTYHILSYNKRELPIYFIGSISHFFQDIILDVAEKNQLTIGGIVQKPIDGLVEFHKKNCFYSKQSTIRSKAIPLDPLINK